MSDLTVKKTLPIGVTVDGQVYKKFSLRVGTLKDSIAAMEMIDIDTSEQMFGLLASSQTWDGIKPEQMPEILMGMYRRAKESSGGASQSVLHYATIAQRISFEGLPQEKVTIDLLMGMFERDVMVVSKAEDEIEKKLDALSSS